MPSCGSPVTNDRATAAGQPSPSDRWNRWLNSSVRSCTCFPTAASCRSPATRWTGYPSRFDSPEVCWDFRWTLTAPPTVPGEDRVRVLGSQDLHHAADLLDRANPTASERPGSPSVTRWVAVPDGAGRLLAVAADTSHRGVGHVSSVATDPNARGQGLGAAVTAYLARDQVTRFGLATLGLYADNDPARRLYDRLGYDHALAMASGPLRRGRPGPRSGVGSG